MCFFVFYSPDFTMNCVFRKEVDSITWIEISYSKYNGIVTSNIVRISGGVMIADKIKMITNAWRLYCLRVAVVISSFLARSHNATGNSNTHPITSVKDVSVEM